MSLKRFKCIVAYDGTNYIGWQKQTNGPGIQAAIEKVLKRISNETIEIIAAGRTDAKVHALGQVFHFDSCFHLDAQGWLKAIRGYMPSDICIQSIEEVDRTFHARFSAIGKEYHYHISLNNYDVFKRNHSYYARFPLDLELMEEASKLFIGKKDFSSFCANSFVTHPVQVRDLTSIEFVRNENDLVLIFKGKGFMRHMVRMIVGTLLQVASHRFTLADVQAMLDAKSKEVCKWNAEPQGLYLVKVDY